MIKPTKPGRANRIADQIQRDVAEITPDYAHATIYFTSIGSTPEEATEALNSAAPMLHSRIFKLLKIHTVPQLHFVYDKSVERGFEMDQLIRQAREEDGEKVKGE